jgi:hypothetical protein
MPRHCARRSHSFRVGGFVAVVAMMSSALMAAPVQAVAVRTVLHGASTPGSMAWSLDRLAAPPGFIADGVLQSVSCTGADFCMAVGTFDGDFGTVGYAKATQAVFAEEWNGRTWVLSQVLDPGSGDVLNYFPPEISCVRDPKATAGNFCVAVSYKEVDVGTPPGCDSRIACYRSETFADVYDGSWHAESPPNPAKLDLTANASGNNELSSVSCASPADCVAVGSDTPLDGGTGSVALWRHGSSWSVIADVGSGNYLVGVTCSRSGFCIAYGSGSTSYYARARPGSSWAPGTLPHSLLYGFSGSCPAASTCIALLASGSSSGGDIATFTRGTWTTTAIPYSARDVMSCPSPGTCTVVTSSYQAQTYTDVSGTWTPTRTSSVPGQTTTVLNATSCVTGFCAAVGVSGTDGLPVAWHTKMPTNVVAVRFAPLADRWAPGSDGVPDASGIPVVYDHPGAITTDAQTDPPCAAELHLNSGGYDWADCAADPPSGTSDKDWPVVFPKGSRLTVNQAVFAGIPAGEKIKATARVGRAKLTLRPAPLEALWPGKTVRNQSSLKFEGLLPARPGKYTMTIRWSAVSGSGTAPAGMTKFTVYITGGKFAAPDNVSHDQDAPALSLINFGSVAAGTDPGSAFSAVIRALHSREVYQPSLDTATGKVSGTGPLIAYYHNGWTLSCEWDGEAPHVCDRSYPNGTCRALPFVLVTSSLHCGEWAYYAVIMLAFQGVTAEPVGLNGPSGFYPGFYPGPGADKDHDGYMLVKPWAFGPAFTGTCAGHSFSLPAPYRYVDAITFNSDAVGTIEPCVSGGQLGFMFSPGGPIAQGEVTTPPGMFMTGDHAIAYADHQFIDPSYGTGPFTTLKAWEKDSIDGFAVLGKLIPGSGGEHLKFIKAGYASTAPDCRNTTCYFIAESRPKAGWPAS